MSTADPLTVAHVRFSIVLRKRASLIPDNFVFGRSKTRKAAKLAVYEATMIIAKPAHTIPRTRAEKLLGVPSPIPLFKSTPHANHIAELRLSASSSVPSLFVSLKRPNGENLFIVVFVGVERKKMRGKNEKKEKEAQASDYYLIYAESNIYTFMNDIHIKNYEMEIMNGLVKKKKA